jgi:hypothetical protein
MGHLLLGLVFFYLEAHEFVVCKYTYISEKLMGRMKYCRTVLKKTSVSRQPLRKPENGIFPKRLAQI